MDGWVNGWVGGWMDRLIDLSPHRYRYVLYQVDGCLVVQQQGESPRAWLPILPVLLLAMREGEGI